MTKPSVGAASIAAVLGLLATWTAVALFWPAWIHALVDYDRGVPGAEGRLESGELVFVLAILVGWMLVALRTRGRGRPFVVACVMTLQMVLVVVEELDWGAVLGLPPIFAQRNLRMTLREAGLLPGVLDPQMLVLAMIAFLLAPLVPLASVQRWNEGARPARAERGDAIAAVLGVVGFGLAHAALGPLAPFEVLEMCEYLVLAIATARALRQVHPP